MPTRSTYSELGTRKDRLEAWLTPGNPHFSSDDWAVIREYERLDILQKNNPGLYRQYVNEWEAYFKCVHESEHVQLIDRAKAAITVRNWELRNQLRQEYREGFASGRFKYVEVPKCTKYDPKWIIQAWPVVRYNSLRDALRLVRVQMGESGDDLSDVARSVFH